MTATDPQELGFLTIPSSADHDATVIWIHVSSSTVYFT